MWLSALMAPTGTIARWKLSSYNGKLTQLGRRLEWFPLGTFLANLIASTVSAAMQGMVDSPSWDLGDWSEHVVNAIKTGSAGNMSTVSTFVAEGSMLQRSFPQHAKAYYYLLGTLAITCAFGLLVYSPMVRVR